MIMSAIIRAQVEYQLNAVSKQCWKDVLWYICLKRKRLAMWRCVQGRYPLDSQRNHSTLPQVIQIWSNVSSLQCPPQTSTSQWRKLMEHVMIVRGGSWLGPPSIWPLLDLSDCLLYRPLHTHRPWSANTSWRRFNGYLIFICNGKQHSSGICLLIPNR